MRKIYKEGKERDMHEYKCKQTGLEDVDLSLIFSIVMITEMIASVLGCKGFLVFSK